jgi:hypothetical protein
LECWSYVITGLPYWSICRVQELIVIGVEAAAYFRFAVFCFGAGSLRPFSNAQSLPARLLRWRTKPLPALSVAVRSPHFGQTKPFFSAVLVLIVTTKTRLLWNV